MPRSNGRTSPLGGKTGEGQPGNTFYDIALGEPPLMPLKENHSSIVFDELRAKEGLGPLSTMRREDIDDEDDRTD